MRGLAVRLCFFVNRILAKYLYWDKKNDKPDRWIRLAIMNWSTVLLILIHQGICVAKQYIGRIDGNMLVFLRLNM